MLWVFFFSGNLLSYPEVWGFLIAGKFYIDIVPEGEVVDQFYYAELLEEKLDHWKGHCDKLIQDLSFWQLPYLWCKGAGPKSLFFFLAMSAYVRTMKDVCVQLSRSRQWRL